MSAADLTAIGRAPVVFVMAVALAIGSAVVEHAIAARAAGLRRRRWFLLGPVADAVKLLSKSAPAAFGPATGALLALLPAVLLVGLLPGPGVGGLLPDAAASGGADHLLLLVALLTVGTHALLVPAAFAHRHRRRELVEAAGGLAGCHVALLLASTAVILDGSGTVLAWSERSPAAWPLWPHVAGAAAFVGGLGAMARGTRRALLGSPPGLVAAPGPAAVWTLATRHLLLGGGALLAGHVYGGSLPVPPVATAALVWAFGAAALAGSGLVSASLTDPTAEGLGRLAWTRLVPLALLDVGVSLVRNGGLPWS